jgi:hypothetical protein
MKVRIIFISVTRFEESDWTARVDDGKVVVVGGYNVVVSAARSDCNNKI